MVALIQAFTIYSETETYSNNYLYGLYWDTVTAICMGCGCPQWNNWFVLLWMCSHGILCVFHRMKQMLSFQRTEYSQSFNMTQPSNAWCPSMRQQSISQQTSMRAVSHIHVVSYHSNFLYHFYLVKTMVTQLRCICACGHGVCGWLKAWWCLKLNLEATLARSYGACSLTSAHTSCFTPSHHPLVLTSAGAHHMLWRRMVAIMTPDCRGQ